MSDMMRDFTMRLTWIIPASREKAFAAWTYGSLMTQWMNEVG